MLKLLREVEVRLMSGNDVSSARPAIWVTVTSGSFPTATTRFSMVSLHRQREVLDQNAISSLPAQIQATTSPC